MKKPSAIYKKKPLIMYALFSSSSAERPLGLFDSRWKANDARNCLWNCQKSWHIKRVYVEQYGITHYDIYKHDVKRI